MIESEPSLQKAIGEYGEQSDGDDQDTRPEDCACWDREEALPCWPCARAGFSAQNPAEPRARTEEVRTDGV